MNGIMIDRVSAICQGYFHECLSISFRTNLLICLLLAFYAKRAISILRQYLPKFLINNPITTFFGKH